MSQTLDQAGAEFAASALVTTDQLLGFKSKEEIVLASGVNGVLASAGECHIFIDLLINLLHENKYWIKNVSQKSQI